MKIDKDTIVDVLKRKGGHGPAAAASRELPDHVDPKKDRGPLSKYGITLDELLEKLPGRLDDKLDRLPGGVGKKLDDLP